MPYFIINKLAQPSGEHEVHNLSSPCSYLPDSSNQIELGFHFDCQDAVAEAKSRYPSNQIDGCAYCAPACHTR